MKMVQKPLLKDRSSKDEKIMIHCQPLYLLHQYLMTSLKLYWALVSQPGRAVKTVIDIGKIPTTLISIDIFSRQQRKGEYLKMYPAGKIPVLQDGDFTIAQSPAIINYLCELYPHISYLRGESIEQRAVINQYISWYQNYFRPAMFKPMRLYLGAVFSQQPILQAHRDTLFLSMHQAIAKLQQILKRGGNKFLAGDKVSSADLLFYFEVTNLVYFGLNHQKYENVKRWYEEVERINQVGAITSQWSQIAKGMTEMIGQVEVVKEKARPKL